MSIVTVRAYRSWHAALREADKLGHDMKMYSDNEGDRAVCKYCNALIVEEPTTREKVGSAVIVYCKYNDRKVKTSGSSTAR